MRPHARGPGRTQWWPENEAWPPTRGHWPEGRRRFVRRIAFIVAAVFALALVGLASIVSHAIGRVAWPAGTGAIGALAAVGVLVLVGVIGAYVRVIRGVGSPLGDVVAAARAVGDGNFAVRVREAGPPFLRTLGRAFNVMTERLAVQEQERRQLVADIAHELRTPLSVVQGRLEGMADGIYAADPAAIEGVLTETRLLARLIDDLRSLANAESGAFALHLERTDLLSLAADVVSSFAPQARAAGVSMQSLPEPGSAPIELEVDPLRLREVFANVISNALAHTPSGGSIAIGLTSRGEQVEIRVTDTGHGIPPEDIPRVFDRFYRGRHSTGTGLGLAIAQRLIQAHGGTIVLDSTIGGTTVTIHLPLIRTG